MRKPANVALGAALGSDVTQVFRDARASKHNVRASVVTEGVFQAAAGAGDALRVVRVKDGVLALAAFRVRSVFASQQEGVTIHRNNNGYLAELFGTKPGKRVTTRWVVTLAVSVPDKGKATVLDSLEVPLVR